MSDRCSDSHLTFPERLKNSAKANSSCLVVVYSCSAFETSPMKHLYLHFLALFHSCFEDLARKVDDFRDRQHAD